MRPELRRITLKFLQTYGICGVIRVWVVSAEARSSSKFADEFSNIYACFFWFSIDSLCTSIYSQFVSIEY